MAVSNCGRSDGGDWRHGHNPAVFGDDDGGQFSARSFDGAVGRAGGPSDGMLLLSGFKARAMATTDLKMLLQPQSTA